MNISLLVSDQIAEFFEVLSVPTRLGILLAIGEREVCVCHLEAVLHLRQAAISQHLQRLKQSQMVVARRQGRFVYYRLKDPQVLSFISDVARMQGISSEQMDVFTRVPAEGCLCSLCNPQNEKNMC